MKSGRRLRRTLAGVLAAGALLTGAAGAIGAGIALSAAPANATPEEDCAAVRARDHQIYLNLIASLPPGAPIPPEIINPCLSAPSTTSTAAPTTTVGLPGVQAPGGGPNVGANAPTNFPTYNGTPIVPVPTIEVPPITSESPASETGVGAFPNASASAVPSPTPTPGEGTTTDRGPGPIPADSDSNIAPAQTVPDPAADVSTAGEDSGRDRYLELALIGAAAFTAAGIGVRGRPGPFSPRTPESVLSQAVGTVVSPLTAYAPGGQSSLRVFDPITGGSRFFFLIHDETSSHESVIPVTVPPGGHMSVNPDGTVTVFDADGNPVSTIDAPWAYDANGTPVPTHYEIRDGQLVQVVDTAGIENLLYPILADPELTPEERAALEAQANFIGPMTPEGEQARRDAQNVLAATPRSRQIQASSSSCSVTLTPRSPNHRSLKQEPETLSATQYSPIKPRSRSLRTSAGRTTPQNLRTRQIQTSAISCPVTLTPRSPNHRSPKQEPETLSATQYSPIKPRSRSLRTSAGRTTPPNLSSLTPPSRTKTEPAGLAQPRKCRTCGVGRTPTPREKSTTCRSPTTSRVARIGFSTTTPPLCTCTTGAPANPF
ncbi:hypothetical protein ACQGFI_31055 [Rhodococcus sp. 2.95]